MDYFDTFQRYITQNEIYYKDGTILSNGDPGVRTIAVNNCIRDMQNTHVNTSQLQFNHFAKEIAVIASQLDNIAALRLSSGAQTNTNCLFVEEDGLDMRIPEKIADAAVKSIIKDADDRELFIRKKPYSKLISKKIGNVKELKKQICTQFYTNTFFTPTAELAFTDTVQVIIDNAGAVGGIATHIKNLIISGQQTISDMSRILRRHPISRDIFCITAGKIYSYNCALQAGRSYSIRKSNDLFHFHQQAKEHLMVFISSIDSSSIRECMKPAFTVLVPETSKQINFPTQYNVDVRFYSRFFTLLSSDTLMEYEMDHDTPQVYSQNNPMDNNGVSTEMPLPVVETNTTNTDTVLSSAYDTQDDTLVNDNTKKNQEQTDNIVDDSNVLPPATVYESIDGTQETATIYQTPDKSIEASVYIEPELPACVYSVHDSDEKNEPKTKANDTFARLRTILSRQQT
jgi:hypothetical protein